MTSDEPQASPASFGESARSLLRIARCLVLLVLLGGPVLGQEPPRPDPPPGSGEPERRLTPPREGEAVPPIPAGSAQQRRLTPSPESTRPDSRIAVYEKKVPLRYGNGTGELSTPQALAVGNSPRSFLVSDSHPGGNKVLVVDRVGHCHHDVRSLRYPGGLAIRGDTVFVADTGAGRISVLDREGRLRGTLGESELESPRDVAVAPDGSLRIADARGRRVVRLDPETGEIEDVIAAGSEGDYGEALTVAVGSRGQMAAFFRSEREATLFLVEPDGERRTIYQGRFERGNARHYAGLVFDPDGNLYAADSKQGEVVVYDERGAPRHVLANSRRGGRLSRPVDVDFTGGRLFVLDAQAFAIWSFRIEL